MSIHTFKSIFSISALFLSKFLFAFLVGDSWASTVAIVFFILPLNYSRKDITSGDKILLLYVFFVLCVLDYYFQK